LVGTAREQICVDERRHGIVLAGAFVRAVALAVPGALAVAIGWPATIAGAALLFLARVMRVRPLTMA